MAAGSCAGRCARVTAPLPTDDRLGPVTEANLGDGIFDGMNWAAAGGRFGVGTDSNVQITLMGELRLFEYSQRLRDRGRAMLATEAQSTGRVLWQGAAQGGAQAAGRAPAWMWKR